MEFTLEEERELRHLGNVLKYAKPKKRNKAQKKLFDFIDKRIEKQIAKHIQGTEELMFQQVFEKEFKEIQTRFRT